MTVNAIDVTNLLPLSRDDAMELQAAELERTLELLRTLEGPDWSAQTDCPDWTVHHMYLHVLGACEASASMSQNLHQMRAAMRHRRRHGGPLEAGLSSVQVRDRIDLSPQELVERLAVVAPVTVRKRTKMPSLMRRMSMKVDGPVVETWKLGYLIDTIYLRDLWMHRVDAARATGRDLELTANHDGRIIADVVAEWARRHQQPFSLILSGPAGGHFVAAGSNSSDGPGELFDLDPLEFCRILGGRAQGTGLLGTIVPF